MTNKKLPFTLLLVLLIGCLSMTANPTGNRSLSPCFPEGQALDPVLTATILSSTSASLSWDAWTGFGDYTVRVINLTTYLKEQEFTTSSTSANVYNLTTGHTYRFEVEKAGVIVIDEIII